MAISNHDYVKVCAQLASILSISLASARRKVEQVASQKGIRDLPARQAIAEGLLNDALSLPQIGDGSPSKTLDHLLEALAEDENFMVED